MARRQNIAVIFGGRSPEHDVSIVSGLQALHALDPDLFEAFPVYISPSGQWYCGEALRERASYVPGKADLAKLTPVVLESGGGLPARLVGRGEDGARAIPVDLFLPVFHGLYGEDGCIQGLFEMAGVPYAGMRVMSAAVLMDKVMTKQALAGTGVPVLPSLPIRRPQVGRLWLPRELEAMYPDLTFPVIVKPRSLGSSIGVSKARDWQELADALPELFRFDVCAVVEPFVQNLVEYNIAVARIGGVVKTSAIEMPKSSSDLLDFKAKYLSSGGGPGQKKLGTSGSQGMLSLTRDINPTLPPGAEANLRRWAELAFEAVEGAGTPRIDFMCNKATGEIWLNEINACPGSLAYFLWEAARPPVLFSHLLEGLIAEGHALSRRMRLPADPTPEDARLFRRR